MSTAANTQDELFAEVQSLRLRVSELEHADAERRRAEEVLPQNEQRYQRLIECVRLIAWEFDYATRRMTYVSPQAEAILGYPAEMWREPRFWFNHLHPEDREWASARSQEHVRRDENHELEYRMISVDGRVVWLKDIVTVSRSGDRPAKLCGIMVDITDRKASEEALRESEEKYRQLFSTESDAILVIEAETRRVLDVNGAAQKLYGYSREEFLKLRATDISAEPEKTIASIESAIGGDSSPIPLRYHKKKDGTEFPVEISPGLFWLQGRKVGCAIIHDVTERKRAEQELLTLADSERTLRRELDHRVRNNLASLVTLIDLAGRSSPDAMSCAASIRNRVEGMAAVHSLLSTGGGTLTNLRALIAALSPGGRSGAIIAQGPDMLIGAAECQKLGIVMNELFTNSTKHGALSTSGGVVTITWSLEPMETGETRATILWLETGGPPINGQPKRGIGARIIEGIVTSDLRGRAELAFPAQGARHVLVITLAAPVPNPGQTGKKGAGSINEALPTK